MALRGVKKDYVVQVTSVKQWIKELEFKGLIIAEVYSSWFGPCPVMSSTIAQIMVMYSESESRIKWLAINVAKLEEEQREQAVEKEQKKQEMASVMRRRSIVAEAEIKEEESTAADAEGDEESEAKQKSAWDKPSVPKLEEFAGYDNPRPLWLFIKDGEILHRLNMAHPPKMMKLVSSVLTDTPLDEAQLSAMDSAAEAKRNRKKLQTSEAKTRTIRLVQEDGEFDQKREPKVILSVSISDLARGAPTGFTGKHPLIAIYEKNNITEAFTYVGKTERVLNDPNPVFNKTFWLDKPKGDKEYKLVAYDIADDKQREFSKSDELGECVINLGQMLDYQRKKFKLTGQDGSELPKTLVWCQAKEPAEPGHQSRFAVIVNIKGLPDGVSQSVVMLQLKDLNIPKFGAVAQSEAIAAMETGGIAAAMAAQQAAQQRMPRGHRASISSIPGGRFVVDQYSLNDRQLRFAVYDSAKFDSSIAWANSEQDKALLGFTTTSMQRVYEAQAMSADGQVAFPVLDSFGKPIGNTELVLRIQEMQIPKEKRGGADDGKPKIEIAVSVSNVARKAESHGEIVAALYRRNADGKFDYVAQSEKLKDVESSMQFWKTFLVDRPVGEAEYKLAVLDLEEDQLAGAAPTDPIAAAAVAAVAAAAGGAPRGELLAEATFDAYQLLNFKTQELKLTDDDGMALEHSSLALTARDIGLVKKAEFAVSCSNLPTTGPKPINPVAALYGANFQTHKWNRGLLAQSERQYHTTNPAFDTGLKTEAYTQADRELFLVIYDMPDHAPNETAAPLSDDRILGEVSFSMNEFLGHRAPQLEYIMMKHGGEEPASQDGSAKVRVWTNKIPGPAGEYDDPEEDAADFVHEREKADPSKLAPKGTVGSGAGGDAGAGGSMAAAPVAETKGETKGMSSPRAETKAPAADTDSKRASAPAQDQAPAATATAAARPTSASATEAPATLPAVTPSAAPAATDSQAAPNSARAQQQAASPAAINTSAAPTTQAPPPQTPKTPAEQKGAPATATANPPAAGRPPSATAAPPAQQQPAPPAAINTAAPATTQAPPPQTPKTPAKQAAPAADQPAPAQAQAQPQATAASPNPPAAAQAQPAVQRAPSMTGAATAPASQPAAQAQPGPVQRAPSTTAAATAPASQPAAPAASLQRAPSNPAPAAAPAKS